MNAFYRLLAANEPLIYIALTLWGLFVLRSMIRTWLEWRNAVYGLEREFALRRLVRSTIFGLLVLGLVFSEFFIATFIVPALPASDILPTPTLNLLVTPANTLAPDAATQAAQNPTVVSAPSGMSGCDPESIMLDTPAPGAVVSGTIELTGTASISNFGFYKYEISAMGTNIWATISAGDKPVKSEKLGDWDTTTLANGDYFLQLVLIDNAGKTLDPCVIAVRVENP
ncbi:MAG: hypothetical protein DCC56_13070 [Anaerolineae bacterium]|nr:MAG: hypothetical protein DCC56_13070 [Anaerolineae bacterium]WKZ42822.1 MAG: hypothetical protein QY302_12040 [Anaerolineales bacterium]